MGLANMAGKSSCRGFEPNMAIASHGRLLASAGAVGESLSYTLFHPTASLVVHTLPPGGVPQVSEYVNVVSIGVLVASRACRSSPHSRARAYLLTYLGAAAAAVATMASVLTM